MTSFQKIALVGRSILALSLLAWSVACGAPERGQAPSMVTNPASLPTSAMESASPAGLLGVARLRIEGLPGSPVAQLEPERVAGAIGDTFDVDISDFLRSSPCRDCLQITGLSLQGPDLLDVGITIAHPFPSLVARKDLHVFDARLIVAGDTAPPLSVPGLPVGITGTPDAVISAGLVANADGYTSFFDGALEDFLALQGLWSPDATNLKPYIVLWEDHTSPNASAAAPTGWNDVDAPRGFNVFPMGGAASDPRAASTLSVRLTPGAPAISVLLAVDVAYGQSAVRATRLTPKYFLPLFSRAEAWKVETALLTNNLVAGQPLSDALLQVEVYDWQGASAADPGFDPSASPLDALPVESDVRQVMVHVPGLLNAPITQPGSLRTGSGVPGDPFLYLFSITNQLSAGTGDYLAVVRVVDDLENSSGPVALNRDLSTPAFDDYATYAALALTVAASSNQAPIADLMTSTLTPLSGASVQFQPGPGTLDPDGLITLFEYDFDYDPGMPLDFTPDAGNTTGVPVSQSFVNPGPGSLTVHVAMRVTDNGVPTLTAIDFDTLTVSPPSTLPVWDFENPSDSLSSLGFTLLGTNGFLQAPPAACNGVLPANTTWGLVAGIGNPAYPGNTTSRALEESGSTAAVGIDQRYYTHVRQAIRTPLIALPSTSQSFYLDLHHWFQFDLSFWVNGLPQPGRWFGYDGAALFVQPAPGGVPTGLPVRLDPIPTQQSSVTHPFWRTFENAIGFNILNTQVPNWCLTNWTAGTDKGFCAVSYDSTVSNKEPVVVNGAASGGWSTNAAAPTWINSRFDLTPWATQEIYLELHFRSKSNVNTGCSTLIGPPCLGCNQNLEALLPSSPSYRISRGWRVDRIAIVEEP